MKKKYVVIIVIVLICVLSIIKFTYGMFTYEKTTVGSVETTSRNPFESGTLAYSIVNNAMKAKENTESTIYSETPLTTPAKDISGETERTLSVTEDDDGNSYYFRGNVKDNYIDFNNMCWRIVRIEGDGSIKLILDDKNSSCKNSEGGEDAFIGNGTFGYKGEKTEESPRKVDYEECTLNKDDCMKTKFDSWFNENNFDKRLLKEDAWNLGNNSIYYDWSHQETELKYGDVYYEKGLKVNKDNSTYLTKTPIDIIMKEYIGTLTVDEVTFAGGKFSNQNINYYLYNPTKRWWTLSPCKITTFTEHRYTVSGEIATDQWDIGKGTISEQGVLTLNDLRPSIVLKSDIKFISGDGTKTNAYKVDENPYDEGTLAYEILKNAKELGGSVEGRTEFGDPKTTPGKQISDSDERVLASTPDDYGTSYYFRGNVQDNFVNFANKCWRIVRIQGDNSVKLILEDKDNLCQNANGGQNTTVEGAGSQGGDNAFIGSTNYGYKSGGVNSYMFDYTGSTTGAKSVIDNWINDLPETEKSKLKTENWCLGNKTDWYDSDGQLLTNSSDELFSETYKRLRGLGGTQISVTLKCDKTNDETVSDIGGLLTADEVTLAGYKIGTNVYSSYLYVYSHDWWLATPEYRSSNYDYAFIVYGGNLNYYTVDYTLAVRPAVVLQSGIEITGGDGTQGNPYNVSSMNVTSGEIS